MSDEPREAGGGVIPYDRSSGLTGITVSRGTDGHVVFAVSPEPYPVRLGRLLRQFLVFIWPLVFAVSVEKREWLGFFRTLLNDRRLPVHSFLDLMIVPAIVLTLLVLFFLLFALVGDEPVEVHAGASGLRVRRQINPQYGQETSYPRDAIATITAGHRSVVVGLNRMGWLRHHVELFAGRPRDELRWAADELRKALGIPANGE